MKTLKIEELSKNFGSTEVLRKINLEIDEGNFLVLLGPSGCGKSTLLNIIAGLETINEGNVFIDDYNVSKVEPKDRNIAMVFQSYALYPNMTVFENIRFPLKVRKIDEKNQKERVLRAASMVELSDFLDRKPSELSGGQRQRVALARAIVREPRVFLMDEPLSSLDAKLRETLRVELKNIQLNLNATILYVTHDQAEATTLADKIGVLKEGKIVQIGTPEEIYENPNSIYVSQRLGSPKINILPGSLFKLDNNIPKIGLRPENIELGDGPYEGKVISIENLGSETVVAINFQDNEILASIQGSYKSSINEKINFDINTNKVLKFDNGDQRIHER